MLMGAHKTQRMVSALTLFRAIPQRWRWISQSHRTSNGCWTLGFICEYWKPRVVKEVDTHTFTKHAEEVWTNVVCLPESWRQLFSTIWKECWWWNSYKGLQ
jgi:hypothetical protein